MDRLTQITREPRFAELTEFALSLARTPCSRFGQLVAKGKQNFGSVATSQRGISSHPGTSNNVKIVTYDDKARTQQCVQCKYFLELI